MSDQLHHNLDDKVTIVFDSKTQRPACVLLQAAYGCPTWPVHLYDSNLWVLFPVPTFVRVEMSVRQLRNHAERLNVAAKNSYTETYDLKSSNTRPRKAKDK